MKEVGLGLAKRGRFNSLKATGVAGQGEIEPAALLMLRILEGVKKEDGVITFLGGGTGESCGVVGFEWFDPIDLTNSAILVIECDLR